MNEAEYRKGYKEFRRKLDSRDFKEKVEISGDEVSAYDVLSALRNKVGEYNNFFMKNLEVRIHQFNRKNGYTLYTPEHLDKKYRRVENIGFYVNEDGSYFIRLYYADGRGRITGTGFVDNFVKLDACDPETIKNKKYLMKCLSKLAEFAEKNPGFAFRWDTLDPQFKAVNLGDDFLGYNLDVYHLDNEQPYFANIVEDSKYIGSFEEEVVAVRGKHLLQRMCVNLNDLEPGLSDIVRKEYSLEGMELVK